MKVIIFCTLFICISSFAKGGGSSIGPSLCSYGAYTCSTPENYTTICIFPKKNNILITLKLANGGDFSDSSNIQSVVTGSITSYESSELKIKILYGINTTDSKLPAYLTYGKAGMYDYPMGCIQNSTVNIN